MNELEIVNKAAYNLDVDGLNAKAVPICNI